MEIFLNLAMENLGGQKIQVSLIYHLGTCVQNLISENLTQANKQLPSLMDLKVDPPKQGDSEGTTEVVLPQVLEDVLALKNQRALELGTEEDAQDKQKNRLDREPLWEKDDNTVNN